MRDRSSEFQIIGLIVRGTDSYARFRKAEKIQIEEQKINITMMMERLEHQTELRRETMNQLTKQAKSLHRTNSISYITEDALLFRL